MSEALSKLKHSRFRHVYAKSVRRSEWYDAGPGHGLAIATNPKMIALAVEVPSGGIVQVAKLCHMGRGRMVLGKIKDHEGPVCDVKWNPFNDNVLATGSHDSTVRIWHIDDMLMIRCLRKSTAHKRRVHTIEWHTTVDNAVFSASLDGSVVLWNIETDEIVYKIENCNAISIALSYDCSEFALTNRLHELFIYDARTGDKKRSTLLVHDGAMPSRVLFYGKPSRNGAGERLITTGSSRNTRRQIAVYQADALDTPLAVMDIDGGSGLLMPIVDCDLNLLYVAGKGDANIRFYELLNEAPFISYLNESSGSKAHTAVCSLPKRGLNVSQCEIMRIFRLDAEQLVIEPLSFIVPRKGDGFQADLFPATRSPTPSLTFREWSAGLTREPILLELKDCVLNCTNKPVTFAKESNRTKLMIADINNDRKFRFLSQVTKPDYREVSDREDREELLKIERIKAKLAAEAAANEQRKEKNEKMDETNGIHIGGNKENENTPRMPPRPSRITATTTATNASVLDKKKSASFSPRITGIIDRTPSPSSKRPTNGETPRTRSAQNVLIDDRSREHFSQNDGLVMKPIWRHKSPDAKKSRPTNGETPRTRSAQSILVDDRSREHSSQNGGLTIKPAWRHKAPDAKKLSNGNERMEEERGQGEDNISGRSNFSEEAMISVLHEMERELHKCRSKCEKLEKIVHLQQQDIDSLRYEIHWKDTRIDFLQKQLQQFDSTRAPSSRSS